MSVQMNSAREEPGDLESNGDMEVLISKFLRHHTSHKYRLGMQVVKSLVVLMAILEVFPILGWIILTAVAIHLLLAGLSGHVVDKVRKRLSMSKLRPS